MGRVWQTRVALAAWIGGAVLISTAAAEPVALRTASGRFLQAAPDGSVRAQRPFPAEDETFELLPLANNQIALKAKDGRLLVAEGRDARTLRADSPRLEPGERETFAMVPADGNRVALRVSAYRDFILFEPSASKGAPVPGPGVPTPAETVEIQRIVQIPQGIRAALALTIRGLVADQLEGKEYDKIDTRKRVEYVELPAPTLSDPKRKKRHRVLSMAEEYHVKARLDGAPDIQIVQMPCLKSYSGSGPSALMFVVRASVPVRGSVRYRIPDTLSASTSFQTVVELAMVGQLQAEKSGTQVDLRPAELLLLDVRLRSLDLSNDVLNTLRRPIEDLINHELRRNDERIRRQANEAIQKAMRSQQFQSPIVQYLGFP